MEAILEGPAAVAVRTPNKKIWAARVVRAIVILFLVVDAAGKILRLAPYVEGTAKVGYPAGSLVPMGIALLASTLLYAVPRTEVLGAVLLTGYLGGATATHVRMGQPFLFPVVFGVLVWACLAVRDPRLWTFLPLVRRADEGGSHG